MKTTVDGVSMDDGMFHLTRKRSMNNKLIVEPYKKVELQANISSGFAFIAQKVTVKGLKVLMEAKLSDGTLVLKGSTAYFKEESLHTSPWAQKVFESDAVKCPFIIANASDAEFISPPEEGALRENS